jgi:hypothetical protein
VSARASAEQAENRYEAAEEAFLAGIREGLDKATLVKLADAVAVQAAAWNSAAYAELHAAATDDDRRLLDFKTERTEVLGCLWADMARAFHGLPALHDG